MEETSPTSRLSRKERFEMLAWSKKSQTSDHEQQQKSTESVFWPMIDDVKNNDNHKNLFLGSVNRKLRGKTFLDKLRSLSLNDLTKQLKNPSSKIHSNQKEKIEQTARIDEALTQGKPFGMPTIVNNNNSISSSNNNNNNMKTTSS